MELQQPHEQQEQQQQLPQFVQIDGQKMFLGGLDYNLLNQQKKKSNKSGIIDLEAINSRINIYSDRLTKKVAANHNQFSYEDDHQTMNLIRIIKNKFENKVPKVGVSVSYMFDTKPHFGALVPQIITRRMVKNQHAPVYVKNSRKFIEQFKLLLKKEKEIFDTDLIVKLTNQKEQDCGGQSDDIFQDGPQKTIANNIQIGKKLDFGIQNDQIFDKYKRPSGQAKIAEYEDQMAEYDKYEFMRKKVKPNVNIEDDGYGQCYNQLGPSLQEMKQLKKAGIQLFGDAKEFKQKQRKVNIGKDYNKVMRIIEERKKKG